MSLFRLALLAALLLQSLPSHAADDAELARAVELYENAVLLYEEGSYDAAIIGFRESFELSKAPELHFNIASCLERMGDLEGAIVELDLYRAYASADERPRLERRMRMLEEKLAQESSTAAAVTPEPAPAPISDPLPTQSSPSRRWGMVGVGAGVAAVGTAGALVSLSQSQSALDANDRSSYDTARMVHIGSWVGVGAGAALCMAGVAIPVQTAHGELRIAPGFLSMTW